MGCWRLRSILTGSGSETGKKRDPNLTYSIPEYQATTPRYRQKFLKFSNSFDKEILERFFSF
jgi:hypothetical protein